jgi:valyl-tRNA synthetase
VVNKAFHNEAAKTQMEKVMATIRAVRNIRAEVNAPMSKQVTMLVKTKVEDVTAELDKNRHYVERFCNTESLVIAEEIDIPDQAMSAVITGAEIFLPLAGLIDFDKEIARLEKELEKWDKEVTLVQKKLANQGFVAKAPEKVVEAERRKEGEYLDKRKAVQARLTELKG